MDLFDATIPPLKRLIQTVPRLMDRLTDETQLSAQLAPDGFNAGQHLCCALGYVARTVLPLLGRDVPDLPFDADAGVIVALAEDMKYLLDHCARHDFDDAHARQITHIAGEATLTQSGQDYALLYALPNAQFHLALGYASLRHAGADIGKGDLDGFHIYSAPKTQH